MAQRRTIKRDPLHPYDFRVHNPIYCCEQCSFYEIDNDQCNLGYNVTNHKRLQQIKTYERTGEMAFCRFQEID